MKLLYKTFFIGLALIPTTISTTLSSLIGFCLYYSQSSMAMVTKTNLKLAFPTKNEMEINLLTRRSLSESLKGFFENFKIWVFPEKLNSLIVIEVEGMENIVESMKQKKGLLMFTPHQGNIEIIIYYLAKNFNCSIPYTKAKLNAFDNLILNARKKIGVSMVETNFTGIKSLLNAIKRNELVAIASDQVPPIESGYITNFFGTKALTMTLVTNLASKTKSPCHSVTCVRLSEKKGFKIIFSKQLINMGINVKTGVSCMNNELEKCIMLAPEQYAWEYKKYKHSSKEDYY